MAAAVQALSQELTGRALPRVAELTDSINAIARSAEAGGSGAIGAKEVLKRLYDALERGKAAAAKIEIARV